MPLTMDDIDDVFNKVSSDVEAWLQEDMAAFLKGSIIRTADSMWNKQPDQVKEAARQQIPAAAKLLDGIRKVK